MNRDTARLVVYGDFTDVFSPYEMRDIMRTIPTRTYSKTNRCWTIHTTHIHLCIIALESAGCTVFVTHPDGTPWSSSQRRTPPPSSSSSSSTVATWVDQAFAACPPANTNRLRKSLLSVFHPDVGGDADTTRRIITAAERSS